MSIATINLRQIEVFYAVMRSGTVTGAARMLNVTQPAISTILKHCESQLKMKLFVRVAGRLQPTPEARLIFGDVAAIFGQLDAVKRLTKDLVGGRLGTLSIAAAFPIATSHLAQAAASFLEAHPDARMALQSLSSRQVLDRVINREVELGIAYEPVVSADVVSEPLCSASIACVMRDDCPLAAQGEVHLRDLSAYPLLTYRKQSNLWPAIERAFSEARIAPDFKIRFGMALSGMMLVHFGAGVALIEPILLDDLRISGIVARPLVPTIETRLVLLRHRFAPRSDRMESFVEHLRRSFAAPFGSSPGEESSWSK